MSIGLHVHCPLFLSGFNETSRHILEKYLNIKFHYSPSSPCGRTGRRTHDKASVRFTQFCGCALKLVDNEEPYRWLKFGLIKGETESTGVAAGDQEISKNSFRMKF